MFVVFRFQSLTLVGQDFPWGYRVVRVLDGRAVLIMRLHGRRSWDLVAFMLEDLGLFRQAVELGFIR